MDVPNSASRINEIIKFPHQHEQNLNIQHNAPIIDSRPQSTHISNDAPTEFTSFITPFGDMKIPEIKFLLMNWQR